MHPWPGNIRQLENVIQRAVAFGETEEVCAADLPTDFLLASATRTVSQVQNFHKAMDETARQLCIAAFKASDGNCREAAHLLGLHRNSIYRLIRRHNLEFLLNS
jgi:transcriptional regulator of acetoin/glycerol metabolism